MLDPAELFAEVFNNNVADVPIDDAAVPDWIPEVPPEAGEDLEALLDPVVDPETATMDDATIDELGESLNDASVAEAVRATMRQVADGGIDAIAFYVPYSVSAPRWGIYFREQGMAAVTISTALRLQRAGGGHYPVSWVASATRRTVLGHELVHFGCEYGSASLEAVAGPGLYRRALSPGHPFRTLQEPIATAIEMRVARRSSAPRGPRGLPHPSVLAAFRKDFAVAWSALPLPAPYDQWPRYSSNPALDRGFRDLGGHLVGQPACGRHLHDAVRLCAKGHRALPVFRLPPKQLPISVPSNTLLPRLLPLSMRKVMAHAERRQRTKNPVDFKIRNGGGHRVNLVRPGKRTVPLDPVKWRNVDYPVVKQLAEFFDLTGDEYCLEVLRA